MKSVLVVAGKLKRAEPDLPEDSLLMRALRDFNTPKIVHSDEVRPIFVIFVAYCTTFLQPSSRSFRHNPQCTTANMDKVTSSSRCLVGIETW